MHETRYKIWRWGDPTGDGSNPQFNVAIRAKAKRSPGNPYELANELLCMRLGLALRLPIPLGVILDKDSELFFASLHVAVAEERLPPAIDEDIDAILRDQWLSCGIIMFDSWVLNEDRFAGNISYNGSTEETFIFDHGRAFYDRTGTSYLTNNKDNICIGQHCLAEHVTGLENFDEWHDRMMEIPRYYIRDCVRLATKFGIPSGDETFCVDFLVDRRERLKDIFRGQYRQAFPKFTDSLLNPFAEQA